MKVAMAFDLDHALRYLIAAEGSDLHLKVPAYPLVRLHGKLEPIAGPERLTPEDTERVVREMLHDPNKLAEFEAENEVDFSYALEAWRGSASTPFARRASCRSCCARSRSTSSRSRSSPCRR
jgi:twitching motility protein PilT